VTGIPPVEAESALDFAKVTGVSRETLDRLIAYGDLLKKWQTKINLVGTSSLSRLWHRHMFDSAQLWPLISNLIQNDKISGTTVMVDLGSGAGFPGLVLAIMASETALNLQVHLVESHQRKGAFLQEAARVTGTNIILHTQRIEDINPFKADVVTARACAPLDVLMPYAAKFWAPQTCGFFLKGQDVEKELVQATKSWSMVTTRVQSQTGGSGTILIVKEVRRV
jgi:16S rRNA (guanine527-N7)-methyltransferase